LNLFLDRYGSHTASACLLQQLCLPLSHSLPPAAPAHKSKRTNANGGARKDPRCPDRVRRRDRGSHRQGRAVCGRQVRAEREALREGLRASKDGGRVCAACMRGAAWCIRGAANPAECTPQLHFSLRRDHHHQQQQPLSTTRTPEEFAQGHVPGAVNVPVALQGAAGREWSRVTDPQSALLLIEAFLRPLFPPRRCSIQHPPPTHQPPNSIPNADRSEPRRSRAQPQVCRGGEEAVPRCRFKHRPGEGAGDDHLRACLPAACCCLGPDCCRPPCPFFAKVAPRSISRPPTRPALATTSSLPSPNPTPLVGGPQAWGGGVRRPQDLQGGVDRLDCQGAACGEGWRLGEGQGVIY